MTFLLNYYYYFKHTCSKISVLQKIELYFEPKKESLKLYLATQCLVALLPKIKIISTYAKVSTWLLLEWFIIKIKKIQKEKMQIYIRLFSPCFCHSLCVWGKDWNTARYYLLSYEQKSTKSTECQKFILLIHHYIIISLWTFVHTLSSTCRYLNDSIVGSLLLCQPSDPILPNVAKMLYWSTRKWPVKLTLLVFTFKRILFLVPFHFLKI